ncbi:MOSC domain-containing protein [Microbacterium aoyamense]|uniref:MOSC domain-containing protein n=1 Tax=Microbacterium aoyamense TaxID=344166 RepID=A0ABP5BF08_9MICO|nr:MOSC N-terminal beta barrel domain-containing protein [Microbacterium aoyamense]
MQVTRLRVYPIKSFAGNDVRAAHVQPWGLEGDRRWAVVDPDGEPITAREANSLLGLTAEILTDGGVLLGDGRSDPVRVDVPMDSAPTPVGHSRQGTALPASAEAAAWLSERLGRDARLVWQPDPTARIVNPKHGGLPGDHVSLADVGPLLLTSEASLSQLDDWAGESLDMVRFRPNVVIDGDVPFAEDDWPSLRLGAIGFRVAGMCDRCVMTTIDPTTLARGKEPIRTLAQYRKKDGKTFFGVWLVPQERGTIAVGDEVTPL